MSMRQREKVQTMLRGQRLTLTFLLFGSVCLAQNTALLSEYGLADQQTSRQGGIQITTYRMNDLTGALALWESLRSPSARPCDLVPFCTADGKKTVITSENYVVAFDGRTKPTKQRTDGLLKSLPNKRDSSLPSILTFLPKEGRVPNSARYVLGPVSLNEFAPELVSSKPGFEQGAEAQVASYQVRKNAPPVRLAVFNYATPEMARLHVPDLKLTVGSRVKRSGLLVAAVLGSASDADADTLLGRVSYEAKITWNESPPPNPAKPMYSLLVNILVLSGLLSLICIGAGIVYGGMRIYRRRYGTLESDEAMTTLHLSGD